MVIKCFLIVFNKDHWERETTGEDIGKSRWDFPVGAMWRANSDNRKPGHTGQCLHVKCYNDPLCIWNIDGQAYENGKYYGLGWTRTGEPPFITVVPSIDFTGTYHGILSNGVLTEVHG